MIGRRRKWRRKAPTTRQLLVGGTVAVVLAQVVVLGLTGQGNPQPIIPERWYRKRRDH